MLANANLQWSLGLPLGTEMKDLKEQTFPANILPYTQIRELMTTCIENLVSTRIFLSCHAMLV